MFDSTTAKATLAIGDPDRTGTLPLSFLCLQLFPLNALPLSPQRSNVQTFKRANVFRPIPFLFNPLCTLLHFFAFSCIPRKGNSFLFSRFRTLCKKPPGV